MHWYTELYNILTHHLFGWRDVVEIALFSTLIYAFSLWLKCDKQKDLLYYFYGYCAIVLGAYHAQLPTVSFLLFATSPIVIMLFIVIHQETLQKNFVMLRNIMPATVGTTDWLETLIRTVLIAANNNKTVTCVIEHTDSLATIMSSPLAMHIDLEKNMLAMILDSESFEQDKPLWINSKGQLLGMNAVWTETVQQEWLDDAIKNLSYAQQEALFFTTKSDAVVLSVNPQTRMFCIIVQGKIFDNINAPHALKTVASYITHSAKTKNQKEHSREIYIKNKSGKQRNA